MSRLITALQCHAINDPQRVAILDEDGALTYDELLGEIRGLAKRLQNGRQAGNGSLRPIGLLADNGKAWAVADLSALAAGIPIIPLPLFFSPSQMAHVLEIAGIDQVLTDQPERLRTIVQQPGLTVEPFYEELRSVRFQSVSSGIELPEGTQKVTFTSGTTGEPKGVCLSREAIEGVAESLGFASAATGDDRHLCILPLATLLENIGGIYTPLLTGATICLPRLAGVGLSGSSGLDVQRMIAALSEWQASTAIMVPQMLQAMVAAGQAGVPMPSALRYLAVGGAHVAQHVLESATVLGLPVYEGYGLSECASVVAVNRPGESRAGSVGKPLPHIQLELSDDGEILVHGSRWCGYLGDRSWPQAGAPFATGDLGYLDADGFLFITGRKKNIFITSFGRNVAPEWVEGELQSQAGIAQAAIFGESRPFNSAVIVPHKGMTSAAIELALNKANQRLPDYAQVRAWIPAIEPFTPANGLSTPNGRLKRSEILKRYASQIDALYQP